MLDNQPVKAHLQKARSGADKKVVGRKRPIAIDVTGMVKSTHCQSTIA